MLRLHRTVEFDFWVWGGEGGWNEWRSGLVRGKGWRVQIIYL